MPDNSDSRQSERLTATATAVATADRSAVVITVCGEIDYSSGHRLSHLLTDACTRLAPRIVVDLSEATFMDSDGLNMVLIAHHQAAMAGGWLRLAGAGERVLRILQIVGVDTVIAVHPTVARALA